MAFWCQAQITEHMMNYSSNCSWSFFLVISSFSNISKLIELSLGITNTWDEWVSDNILVWETVATTWIHNLKRGGVVYYEHLRDDTESELRRVLKMLSFPVNDERLNCVLQIKDNNAFKRRKINQTRIEYVLIF